MKPGEYYTREENFNSIKIIHPNLECANCGNGCQTVVQDMQTMQFMLMNSHTIRHIWSRMVINAAQCPPDLVCCPFCGESDFDTKGLKYHLQTYCHDTTENVS